MTAEIYEPRSARRIRSTRADMDRLTEAITAALAEDAPMTVRQLFYRLVVLDVVPKDEQRGYRRVLRQLTALRDAGLVSPANIVDGTRRIRVPWTSLSLEEALQDAAQQYRRHVWANQTVLPVVMLEKVALAGVVEPVTEEWDVPLVPVQGFSSISLIWQTAQHIRASGKPAVVHYFGDWDPSGSLIDPVTERRLREYLPDWDLTFVRESITPDQIEAWSLPTRPTKRVGNNHAKGFVGDSVELDALPADALRTLVRSAIERHVDRQALAVLQAAEDSEREILTRMAARRWKS